VEETNESDICPDFATKDECNNDGGGWCNWNNEACEPAAEEDEVVNGEGDDTTEPAMTEDEGA